MIAIITRIVGASAVSFVTSKIGIITIAGALLLLSNGLTAVVANVKGYNKAAAKCQTQSLKREIKEVRRDLGASKETSEYLNENMRKANQLAADRAQKVAEYETKITPVKGCVTPADFPAGRVRSTGAR